MAFNNDFYCEVDEGCPQHVIDEKGNTYLELCTFRWNGKGEYKLGIRKVYSNAQGDHPGKSLSFLTEDGPHDLTHALITDGYGNPDELVEICMDKRPDVVGAFAEALKDKDNIDEYIDAYHDSSSVVDEEEMYDPEEILDEAI